MLFHRPGGSLFPFPTGIGGIEVFVLGVSGEMTVSIGQGYLLSASGANLFDLRLLGDDF
jgi:hypothetical protein